MFIIISSFKYKFFAFQFLNQKVMKTLKLFSMFVFVLFLGTSITSCKKVSDADLQAEIQEVLATNPDAENVNVTVSDKVVTLTGTVNDDAAKAAIDSIVASIKHVKSVVNELEVVPPAPDYSELDQIIEASLPEILVEYPKLTASVREGVVTLSGEAKQAEIDSVMKKIQDLNPVDIINETTVK